MYLPNLKRETQFGAAMIAPLGAQFDKTCVNTGFN